MLVGVCVLHHVSVASKNEFLSGFDCCQVYLGDWSLALILSGRPFLLALRSHFWSSLLYAERSPTFENVVFVKGVAAGIRSSDVLIQSPYLFQN